MIILSFSRKHTVSSNLIKFFTWSPWSHIDAIMEDGSFVGSFFKKHGPLQRSGVVVHDGSDIGEYSIRELCINLDEQKYYQFLTDQIGKSYDWTSYLGFLFRSDKWDAPDSWFCSELIAAAINYATNKQVFSIGANRITPVEILNMTRSLLDSKDN